MGPRITHSIAAQATGAGFNAALSFALLLLLARAMGASGFGDYVALLSVASVLLIAIEGGWNTLVYRTAATPGGGEATSLQLARGAFAHGLAAAATLAAAAWLAGAPGLAAALACMGAVAAMNLVSARLRGAGRFGTEALWQAGGRVASLLAIAWAVTRIDAAPVTAFLGWGAGLVLCLAAWGWRWLPRPSWPAARAGYALAWPLVMFEGLNAFLFKGDAAVLKAAGMPAAELAQYAACTRFTEAAVLLFAPVVNVLLLHLRRATGEPAAFARLAARALAAAASLGVACCAGSALLGERLVPALFGAPFAAAGALLPWVALMLVFALPNQVLFQMLLARGRERTLAAVLAAGALALLAGLLFGAHADGASGAALGVAAAQALVALACAAGLRARNAA